MVLAQHRQASPARTVQGGARLAHLIVLLACAAVGLGILAMVALAIVGPDEHSRDMAILGLIITAPLWIFGVAAAVDAYRVLRGRPVSEARALGWAGLVTAGGFALVAYGGHLEIVLALVSSRLRFTWPVLEVGFTSGDGAMYFHLDDVAFWLPLIAVALGVSALVATVLAIARNRRGVTPTPTAGRPVAA